MTVATRNRASVLAHCLGALTRQSLPPDQFEILVVDDGSADGTPAVIAAAQQRGPCVVRAVRFAEHRGVAAARNAAVREARGAIMVFVDSDSLAVPGFLAAHLTAHGLPPGEIVARGPIISTESLDLRAAKRWSLMDLNTSFFDTDNASVPTGALRRAGPFDEGQVPYGWIGLEMGLRLRALGLQRRYVRDAVSYHYQPPLTPETLAAALRKEEDRARNAKLFWHRHPTLEVRLMTSQTALHRCLNLLQRGFGVVNADNLLSWVDRSRRWRMPALGRILVGGVLTERYLRCFRATPPAAPAACGAARPAAEQRCDLGLDKRG